MSTSMKTNPPATLRNVVLFMGIAPWVAAPALAQDHSTMHMPMDMPMPTEKPAAQPPAKKAAATPATHVMHGNHMAAPPGATAAPAVGKEQAPVMPDMHDMHDMPAAPNVPVTPIPVLTDADRAAARPPQDGSHPAHDNSINSYTRFDRLEVSNANPGATLEWDGRSWIGTDLNRVWLRSEGERTNGVTQAADVELLYGRSVATWWDVVIGGRHDFKPGASQDFAAIGLIGTAPYKIEVQATGYIGQGGQTSARVEAEYETLLTNRLVLQPLVEANFFGKDDARRGIGSGLSTIEAGLRLRYEITRRFAPYIGVVREHAFGRTAELRRADGDDTGDTRFVAGLRVWF